ncbi:MAG TPA: hypothetical protein VIM89_11210 [Mucilaginibacter sp.]
MKLFRKIVGLGLCAVIPVCALSCNEYHAKFNRLRWNTKEDWDYPYRDEMINDLTTHHQLRGLSYKQLIDSLGNPENLENTDGVYYQITMDFGSDIDPVHTKYLVFKLNKDSVVNDFTVKEWKKE